jgi:hypothetical protein
MKRLPTIVPALLVFGLAFGAAGCVVHGSGRVHTGVYARPATVQISPGIYVVEDYHEPVFYSDGWYWRYYGGVWYRSSYHSHGWVRWRHVPHGVARIHNPQVYVRYRGNANVRGGSRGTVRSNRPAVRDHRDGRGNNSVGPSRGGVRDHRGATPVRVHKPNVDHRGSDQVRHKNDGGQQKKKKSGVKTRDHR